MCWNYVASCTPAVVLGLNGQLRLVAVGNSERTLNAEEFLLGPLETARAENELLLAVEWPSAPSRAGSAYRKWGKVTDALPVVGVCCL